MRVYRRTQTIFRIYPFRILVLRLTLIYCSAATQAGYYLMHQPILLDTVWQFYAQPNWSKLFGCTENNSMKIARLSLTKCANLHIYFVIPASSGKEGWSLDNVLWHWPPSHFINLLRYEFCSNNLIIAHHALIYILFYRPRHAQKLGMLWISNTIYSIDYVGASVNTGKQHSVLGELTVSSSAVWVVFSITSLFTVWIRFKTAIWRTVIDGFSYSESTSTQIWTAGASS